jgi:quercetin dioxygenase-like cupin family protein
LISQEKFIETNRDHADDFVVRDWPPRHVIPEHTHPFALRALVTQGQMWLTVDGIERALLPGDTFELSHGKPHAERYGPQGATYLVARRRE